MARTALSALGDLGRLEADSFFFISDEADDRAFSAVDGGLGIPALDSGLGTSALQLGPVPVWASAPSFDFSPDVTFLKPPMLAAKGGQPGPPPGAGPGGGSEPVDDGGTQTTSYYSGSSLGTDTNPGSNDPGYDIWIEFIGDLWTGAEDLMQAFKDAADYLTWIITDDIGGGGTVNDNLVDDLYVSAELVAIDGTGGVLGRAGPTAVWTANDLTAAGLMEFDIADAQDYYDVGLWGDIVMHELMHVLGFGTLWEYGSHDLVDKNNYIGQSGLDAYRAMVDPTATSIPVEEDGGRGTAGGHWDEGNYPKDLRDPIKLDDELMTGFIDSDGDPNTIDDNYLSAFSVMSLQDLGYAVNYEDYPYDGTDQPYEEPDAFLV